MADLQEIKAETERLVALANERLLDSVKRSQRQVVLAEWREGSQGQSGYYDVRFNCDHSLRVSPADLRVRMLCLDCVKEKLL